MEASKFSEFSESMNNLTVTFLVVLLVACLFMGYLLEHYKITFIHESGTSLLLGAIVGLIFYILEVRSEEVRLRFNEELFFYVLLPPIIFDQGFTMRKRKFFRNLVPILGLGAVGTILSTTVIAGIVFGCFKAGWLSVDKATDPLAFLFLGVVMSATDSVAFVSLMSSQSHSDVYSLVFGESVVNDAVTIALFRSFSMMQSLEGWDGFLVISAQFAKVMVGSVLVGVAVGLSSAFVFKSSDLTAMPHYQILLTVLFAYSSYLICEVLHLSGIVALFFCGLIMAHYNWYQMSTEGQSGMLNCVKAASCASETFIFCYLGLDMFSYSHNDWAVELILLTLVALVLGRAANVFGMSVLSNLCRCKPKRTRFRQQLAMWFAGCSRGAVAFALALSTPRDMGRGFVVTTTLAICISTSLLWGVLTTPVMRCLGIMRTGTAPLPTPQSPGGGMDSECGSEPRSPPPREISRQSSALTDTSAPYKLMIGYWEPERTAPPKSTRCANFIHVMWRRLDDRVMKPVFGGRPRPSQQAEPRPGCDVYYGTITEEANEGSSSDIGLGSGSPSGSGDSPPPGPSTLQVVAPSPPLSSPSAHKAKAGKARGVTVFPA